jgi:hypothetical protein
VVGPIVTLGYVYEVVEKLHVSQGKHYPDFTFDRFMPYLTRGLWPFIVQMCTGMVMGVVFGGLWFIVAIVVAAIAANNPNAAWIAPTAFFSLFAVIIIVAIGISFALLPVFLWAGLAQEFSPGAMWGFMKDFLGLTLTEVILSRLFNSLVGTVVTMIALLLCCLPVLPAAMLVMFANAHLTYQLYELYLERGGNEIVLKVEDATQPNPFRQT